MTYAKALIAGTEIELAETEESQNDESLWMFLGRDAYAHADYWHFRKQAVDAMDADPRIWEVTCTVEGDSVRNERVVFNEDTFLIDAIM